MTAAHHQGSGSTQGSTNSANSDSTKLGTPKAPGTITLPRVSLELALDSIVRHTSDTYYAMQPPVTLTKKQKKELLERAQQVRENLSAVIEFLAK